MVFSDCCYECVLDSTNQCNLLCGFSAVKTSELLPRSHRLHDIDRLLKTGSTLAALIGQKKALWSCQMERQLQYVMSCWDPLHFQILGITVSSAGNLPRLGTAYLTANLQHRNCTIKAVDCLASMPGRPVGTGGKGLEQHNCLETLLTVLYLLDRLFHISGRISNGAQKSVPLR